MRYILIFILLVSTLFAETKKENLTIGLGLYMQSQPYKNVDAIILPSPVVFYDNDIFYIRWSRLGLYFLGDKKENYAWGFSLTAQPRTYGYDDIYGMENKKSTWEGGLAFSFKYDKAYIETMLLNDLLNTYKSWIYKTEIGYDFKVGEVSFYPSFIAVYQSSDFLNYYYGVNESESIKSGKNIYTPNSGLDVALQTYIKYPLTKNLSTLINIRADKLSNQAYNSPLVDQHYIYSGLASLIYSFNL